MRRIAPFLLFGCPPGSDTGDEAPPLPTEVRDLGEWPVDCIVGAPDERARMPTVRDSADVWTVGGWRTEDRGNTWVDQHPVEVANPERYHRDDDRLWWLNDGVLRFSDDDGSTFTPLLPPLDPSYVELDVRGDRMAVWSGFGDDLLYTQDGGDSWRRIAVSESPAIAYVVKQASLGPEGHLAIYRQTTPSDHVILLSDDHGETLTHAFEAPLTSPALLARDAADALWILQWGAMNHGGEALLQSPDWGASWNGGILVVPTDTSVANELIAWWPDAAADAGLLFRARMNLDTAAREGDLPSTGAHVVCQTALDGNARIDALPAGRQPVVDGDAVVVGRFHANPAFQSAAFVGNLLWTDELGAAIYDDEGAWWVHPTAYGGTVDVLAQPGQTDLYALLNPVELGGVLGHGPRIVRLDTAGNVLEEREFGPFRDADGQPFWEAGRDLEATRVPIGPEGSWPLARMDSGLYVAASNPEHGVCCTGSQGPFAVHPTTGETFYVAGGWIQRTSVTQLPCDLVTATPYCYPLPSPSFSDLLAGQDGYLYAWDRYTIWRREIESADAAWEEVVNGLIGGPSDVVVEVVGPGHSRLWIADYGNLVAADLGGDLPVTRHWRAP